MVCLGDDRCCCSRTGKLAPPSNIRRALTHKCHHAWTPILAAATISRDRSAPQGGTRPAYCTVGIPFRTNTPCLRYTGYAKNLHDFWPLLATPGRGQTISGAAAMAVPSSIGTGTPAPAIRLPLDPAPTHPRERPFRRNRACDLIFKRDRQRCGDGASPKRPVCHSHSPHPQLPT